MRFVRERSEFLDVRVALILAISGIALSSLGNEVFEYVLLEAGGVRLPVSPFLLGVVLAVVALLVPWLNVWLTRRLGSVNRVLVAVQVVAGATVCGLGVVWSGVGDSALAITAYSICSVSTAASMLASACITIVVRNAGDDGKFTDRTAIRLISFAGTSYAFASIAGPLVGVLVSEVVPESGLIVVSGALAVAAGLAALPVRGVRGGDRGARAQSSVRLGIRKVLGDKVIAAMLLGLSVSNLTMFGLIFALPSYSRGLESAPLLALLLTAPVIGTLFGNLLAGLIPSRRFLVYITVFDAALRGFCVLMLGVSRSISLSVAVLAVAGLSQGLSRVGRQTLLLDRLQREDRVLGMSAYASANRVLLPLGPAIFAMTMYWAGSAAITIQIIGVCLLVIGVLVAWRLFAPLRVIRQGATRS
ncbi:hypothetical protein ACFVWL_18955 [Microbacterium sp. NPDC058269]|uniref:hypothetical protein n=1 Tax=Microbacterium sp. NPDC058269 TaxID=3346414 RepID=UPI0036DADBE2